MAAKRSKVMVEIFRPDGTRRSVWDTTKSDCRTALSQFLADFDRCIETGESIKFTKVPHDHRPF